MKYLVVLFLMLFVEHAISGEVCGLPDCVCGKCDTTVREMELCILANKGAKPDDLAKICNL